MHADDGVGRHRLLARRTRPLLLLDAGRLRFHCGQLVQETHTEILLGGFGRKWWADRWRRFRWWRCGLPERDADSRRDSRGGGRVLGRWGRAGGLGLHRLLMACLMVIPSMRVLG